MQSVQSLSNPGQLQQQQQQQQSQQVVSKEYYVKVPKYIKTAQSLCINSL